ncbi:MAG: hypothetical protein AB8G99_06115 [Planctomycetaceae bacterium]
MTDVARDRARSVLLIALGLSLILNLLFGLAYARMTLEAGMAASMVTELYRFADEPKTAAEAESMVQYVESYYPSGTKVRAGTALDAMVESVRAKVIDQLRTRSDQ